MKLTIRQEFPMLHHSIKEINKYQTYSPHATLYATSPYLGTAIAIKIKMESLPATLLDTYNLHTKKMLRKTLVDNFVRTALVSTASRRFIR